MTWIDLATLVGIQWLAFSVVMSGIWVVQQRTGNSGWVDVGWTFGLGAVAAVGVMLAESPGSEMERRLLVAALVTVWAMRLGLQIVQRTLSSTDDPRYRELADQWGEAAHIRMLGLLVLQALVSVPLIASIDVAALRPGPAPSAADVVGAAVMLAAIAGEGISDRQLWRFRHAPDRRHTICRAGLWRYSRHPNYFFQWLGWLAYAVIAIEPAGSYGFGWLSLTGALCMYALLVHVSGIPPLEAHMVRSRGKAYRDYQATTSAFFPLPPGNSRREVS